MKYYRRHKHELDRTETDEPLPLPPTKKMRYGRNDDVLLAQHFANKPEGTSDKVFQEFAKIVSRLYLPFIKYVLLIGDHNRVQYPHHPWKGWQEHHRIHKAKIDHFIQKIHAGDIIEPGDEE